MSLDPRPDSFARPKEGTRASFAAVIAGSLGFGLVCAVCGFGSGLAVGRYWEWDTSGRRDSDVAPNRNDEGPVTELPDVERNVPRHELAILAGCDPREVRLIVESIDDAIALGAPTYNQGDFHGCYTTYRDAAERIEVALSSTCAGPAAALADGRARAIGLPTSAARAWAMRDAFDGLLDVIDRSRATL